MDNKAKTQIAEPLVKRLPYFNYVVFAFSLNIVLILLVLLLKDNLPPEIPLFYGLSEGEEQLGANLSLVIPPLISICFVALNSLVSLFTKDLFLKKVLVITGISTTILSAITVLKIIILVGTF